MPARELEICTLRALTERFKKSQTPPARKGSFEVSDTTLMTLQALAAIRAADALERIADCLVAEFGPGK